MPALISIIVPVYNVGAFLLECLESISAQTYPHFECLLVNDGSTDNSSVICKQFCEKDSRFRLLQQNKKGVSAARNMGLDAAKGDCFLFVDSDDVLFPEALQTAWQELDTHSCDWIMFDYLRANSSNVSLANITEVVNKHNTICSLDCDAAMRGLMDSRDLAYCVVWNKLYTRHSIGDIRFKSVSYAEDLLFNYEVFRRTKRIVWIHQTLYLWRIREGSLTSINTPIRYFSHFKAIPILEIISRDDALSIRGLCLQKIYRQLLIARVHLMDSSLYADFFSIAQRMKDDTFLEYWSNNCIPLFEKLRFLMLWSCPRIMKSLFKNLGN